MHVCKAKQLHLSSNACRNFHMSVCLKHAWCTNFTSRVQLLRNFSGGLMFKIMYTYQCEPFLVAAMAFGQNFLSSAWKVPCYILASKWECKVKVKCAMLLLDISAILISLQRLWASRCINYYVCDDARPTELKDVFCNSTYVKCYSAHGFLELNRLAAVVR